MTDKELGTAAGDIFAKAFTLGYETGREYVPVGGRVLTAEQVEDVRALVWLDGRRNFDAFRRLRALFPATEPAEDAKPIVWYRTMTPKFATEYFGFPDGSVLGQTHTASDGGTWGWCGDDWELLVYPPAPAEPAEEETKAEDESGWHLVQSAGGYYSGPACTGGYGCRSMAHYDGCLRPSLTASSPVVPAPTETGPWQTWEAVPEGATVKSANGERFRKTGVGAIHLLTNGVGDCCKISTATDLLPAQFVAVEEG